MVELLQGGSLIAATLATGLMAGLFFAYACSVMLGLRGAADRAFVDVMQRINVAILNPWFGVTFAGALVFTGLAGALHLGQDWRAVLPWIAAAFVLYAVTLAITFRINIPLNDELAAAGEPDRLADPAAVRERFEAKWVRWNVVRAVTSMAAFGCLTWALVVHGRVVAPG
jgi:uncharacterized membrane protein